MSDSLPHVSDYTDADAAIAALRAHNQTASMSRIILLACDALSHGATEHDVTTVLVVLAATADQSTVDYVAGALRILAGKDTDR